MTKATLAAAAAALAFAVAPAMAQDGMPEDRGLSTLPSGTYTMDKTHGYVTMSYSHLGYSNPILRFNDIDATVTVDADNISNSTLMVEIDPASIDSGVAKFDEHLVGGDFFDVANNPEITFKSTSLALETAYSGTLTGDLTIKGNTKPVTLNVTLNRAAPNPFSGKQAFGISATGELMRSDFGLGAYTPNVGDKVSLQIEAEFGMSE